MKSGQKRSDKVVCPFYDREGRQVIYCEGVEEGTKTQQGFDTPNHLKDYKARYCDTHYQKCMIAQMLERKYE